MQQAWNAGHMRCLCWNSVLPGLKKNNSTEGVIVATFWSGKLNHMWVVEFKKLKHEPWSGSERRSRSQTKSVYKCVTMLLKHTEVSQSCPSYKTVNMGSMSCVLVHFSSPFPFHLNLCFLVYQHLLSMSNKKQNKKQNTKLTAQTCILSLGCELEMHCALLTNSHANTHIC